MDDDKIQVDTGALRSAAHILDGYNQAIAKQFSDMENAVWRMRQEWSGLAYVKTCELFDRIKNNYNNERCDEMSLYTNALRRAADAYEGTEHKIHSTASAFK